MLFSWIVDVFPR